MAVEEFIQEHPGKEIDMMTDNPPQGKREEVKEPIQSPDSLETGETVRTPRGTFHVTDMSREQMEAAGYGFHHQSGDGKYLVMSNGSRAFAIRNEPEQGRPARAAKAARGKGIGEKQLKKKKGKEMER